MKVRLVVLLVLILSAFPMAAHSESFVFDLSKTQVLTGENFSVMYAWTGDFKPVSVTFTTVVPAGLVLYDTCNGIETCTFTETLSDYGYGGIGRSIQAWAIVEGSFDVVTTYNENGGSLSGNIIRTVTVVAPTSFTLQIDPQTVTEKQTFTMKASFVSAASIPSGLRVKFTIPEGVVVDLAHDDTKECRNGKGCFVYRDLDAGAPGTRLAIIDAHCKKAGIYTIRATLLQGNTPQTSMEVDVRVSK